MRNRLALLPSALVIGLVLTACASSNTNGTTPAGSVATSVAESQLLGSDPRTWVPQTIEPGSHTVQAGQFLILEGLSIHAPTESIGVSTSDKQVVVVTQSGPDDYAMVQALRPGTSVVTVFVRSDFNPVTEQADGEVLGTFILTVEGGLNSATDAAELGDPAMPGSDPATWAPVVVTGDSKFVTLTTRQYAIVSLEAGLDSDVELSTSDRDVVVEAGESADGEVLVEAMNAGEATLTLTDTSTGKVVMTVQVTVVDLDANP